MDAGAFATTQRGAGAVQDTSGYNVRFYNLTGDPVFDAVLQDFPAAIGPGQATMQGVDVPSAGVGYTVVRLPAGPFVEFRPIV